jgi:RND family efflux transporter MFP subunit
LKRFVLVLLAIAALAAAGLGIHDPSRARLFAALGIGQVESPARPVPTEPPAPAVTVAEAALRVFRDQLFVSGTLVAREEALVGVGIDGLRITEVLAEDGDIVRAGQVLARLDRSQLDTLMVANDAAIAKADASIAQARATVQQFEATLTQVQADFERARQLGVGITSQATLDQRQALARATQAQLEGARGALAVAQADRRNQDAQRQELAVRIGRTEVRAPVAGVISRRNARVGALAMGSADPLFRIVKDGAIDLDAEAPDDVLGRVRIGLKAQVTPAGDDGAVEGSVRLVSSEVDRATRLGRIRIAMPAPADGRTVVARVGGFASAVIEVVQREGVSIPASAVTRGERGRAVQVVTGGRVDVRRVDVGLAFRDVTEITDGLKPGELVVARAAAFLRSGDTVRPIRPNVTAAAPATTATATTTAASSATPSAAADARGAAR